MVITLDIFKSITKNKHVFTKIISKYIKYVNCDEWKMWNVSKLSHKRLIYNIHCGSYKIR